jgi:hypothetical protein
LNQPNYKNNDGQNQQDADETTKGVGSD